MQLETTQSTIHHNPTHSPEVLQRLFTENYRHLQEEASGPGFTIEEIDRIIEATRGQLHLYNGPDDDAGFCSWITAIVAPARDRERTARFLAMMETHNKIVKKGIWSIISKCSDLGAHLGNANKGIVSMTVEELEQTVWFKVFEDLDRWLLPGFTKVKGRKPAKLTTRLYEFARLQAMGWRTDRIRARKRFVPIFDEDGVCVDERLAREHGKLLPRPIVLGPGDDGAYDKPAAFPELDGYELSFDDEPCESEEDENNPALAA